MNTDAIVNRCLLTGTGKVFYRFSNAEGKTWLMPASNMRTAMNLYQPSGIKGKMVKSLLPWLHRIPAVRSVLKAETVCCRLTNDLAWMLRRLFEEQDIEFSIFGGTPSVHQKVVMQVSKGDKILGYAKLTDNEDIARMFGKESDLLGKLWKKGITDIPKNLFCGTLPNGLHLFVQSTVKTRRSLIPHHWCRLHDDFLQDIYQKTKRELPFEQTDYFLTLQHLRQHLDWIVSDEARDTVRCTIERTCQKNCGKTVAYGVYHGDFTPWNMIEEKGALFVFDWEYAHATYPAMLDRYHFFTQKAISEKHWQTQDFISYIEAEGGRWMEPEAYTLYLLDVIARFTLRENGPVRGNIGRSIVIYSELLNYLDKK